MASVWPGARVEMAATDEAGFASAPDWRRDALVVSACRALVCGYVGVSQLWDGMNMGLMVYL